MNAEAELEGKLRRRGARLPAICRRRAACELPIASTAKAPASDAQTASGSGLAKLFGRISRD
jgi:hypothetical protein